jgi:hypothetical protein
MAKSRSFGPFERFSSVDGLAYTDDRVFAFADARIGDWFCYDDGRHWALMVVTDVNSSAAKTALQAAVGLAPALAGVIGLWEGARMLYLGRARSIRARLQAIAAGDEPLDAGRVTAVTWECHANPKAREAELCVQYMSGSRSLSDTYGRLHGNLVRTSWLIERAVQTVANARSICEAIARRRQTKPAFA